MGVIAPLFRESLHAALRDRWWAAAPVLALALTPLLWGVHRLALGGAFKAAQDVGLASTWLVGCLVALGLGLRTGAPRRATIWILVRPVSLAEWLLARTAGALCFLALLVAGLLAAWHLAAALNGLPAPPWLQGTLLWAELSVLYALASLLATATRTALAPLAAVGLWLAGHLGDEYLALAAEGGVPGWLARLVFAIVPDLDLFDARVRLVHDGVLDGGRLALALAFALVWVLALTALSHFVLSRRDLP